MAASNISLTQGCCGGIAERRGYTGRVQPRHAARVARCWPSRSATSRPVSSTSRKWDGFRSIIFRDGDEVEIGSRNERPMTRYFPEVVEAVKANFPARRGHRRRDRRRRRRAQHAGLRGAAAADPPRRQPGRSCCRSQTPAQLHRVRPARARRRRPHWSSRSSSGARALEQALGRRRAADPPHPDHPATSTLAQRWFEQFEGAGSGRADRQAARPDSTSRTSG